MKLGSFRYIFLPLPHLDLHHGVREHPSNPLGLMLAALSQRIS